METLRYVVLVNGLLAVVSIAYYVLLRRETFFGTNRLALWLGLIAALVLPLLELPDWRPQPVRTAMQQTAQLVVPKVLPKRQPQSNVTITFPNERTYQAFQNQEEKFTWSWQIGVLALYICGVITLLVRFSIQLISLQRLIRRSAHDLYDDFTLVKNERVTSPFSFFNWVVLNPDHHTAGELEQILRHERVHVRERHSLDMIATELICIVFWFNPAAYLFRYLLQQTLEFRADHVVLAEGIDAKLYQYNLLKVSLSADQSSITNHFSKSQLKSRIGMLNQQKSSKVTWLKYPVFFLATLTIASAFARPQHVKTLSKYVPKYISETIVSVAQPRKASLSSPTEADLMSSKSSNLEIAKGSIQEFSAQQTNFRADSTNLQSLLDVAGVSPSRYMVYQGDYLYWIITPKTTIDDFAVMKQEFAKHGYQLQLSELKYDPLDTFIDGIMYRTNFKANVSTPTSNLIFQGESSDDLKPITTIAGYISTNKSQLGESSSSRLNGRYSKTFPLYQTKAEEEFPDPLRQVADDDETFINQFINDKKMEYLVLEGERKYSHLGIGFRKFDEKEIKKQSRLDGTIRIQPDGSLSINEGPGPWVIKPFINNEPVTLEDVRKLNISKLYTMAVILGYDPATQKRSGTDYFLFYVNEPQ